MSVESAATVVITDGSGSGTGTSTGADTGPLIYDYPELQRYIIARGIEGFCDRLEALSYAISHARKFGRTLNVNWDDHMWCHMHGTNGFDAYFTIVGIPYTNVTPYRGSIYPAGEDPSRPVGMWIYGQKPKYDFKLFEADRPETIIIHSCIGFRRYDWNELCNHLRFQPYIAEHICNEFKQCKTKTVVHLRGTDRSLNDGQMEALMNGYAGAGEKPEDTFVISDDASLMDKWLERFPETHHDSAFRSKSARGIHQMTGPELARIGISKHDLNLRMLTDFVRLAFAEKTYALQVKSYFYRIPTQIGGRRVLQWFGDIWYRNFHPEMFAGK